MAIALYMDVHIPKAITVGLRLRGVEVLTAQEDGRKRPLHTIKEHKEHKDFYCSDLFPKPLRMANGISCEK